MSEADRTKWNQRYAGQESIDWRPAAFLVELDDLLPRSGAAIDVAGGTGRNALWLAERGLDVTLADISSAGLAIAREEAERRGLELQQEEIDLKEERFPAGPWDLIVMFSYLQRSLFEVVPEVLTENGLLVFAQPTKSNLARHEKPPAPFLLDDGELPSLIAAMEVIRYQEGWFGGRHEARSVARKRSETA